MIELTGYRTEYDYAYESPKIIYVTSSKVSIVASKIVYLTEEINNTTRIWLDGGCSVWVEEPSATVRDFWLLAMGVKNG